MTTLESMENHRTEALRQSMQEAGCVFDFTVYKSPFGAPAEDREHRAALAGLFAQIAAKQEQHRREVIAHHPEYAKHKWFELRAELDQARPRRLNPDEVAALVNIADWRKGKATLYAAFRDPPHGTGWGDKQAETRFAEWLDVLRLHPRENITVLDWVGNPDENPGRSAWSNYFDDGKEWWGIWCLTIWNPMRRTLSALAASTTD